MSPGMIKSLRLDRVHHVFDGKRMNADIQRLEMFAILYAVRFARRAFQGKIVIFCDNYVVCSMFWPWCNTNNPRLNSMRDLILKMMIGRDFKVVFMRGHQPFNSRKCVVHRMADSLAKEARRG